MHTTASDIAPLWWLNHRRPTTTNPGLWRPPANSAYTYLGIRQIVDLAVNIFYVHSPSQLVEISSARESEKVSMYHEFGAVLVFIFVGTGFVIAGLLAGALIRLKRKHGEKHSTYECGEPTIGSSWIRFNSRFYNIALVYLLFDVEVVVLVPAMLVFRERVLKGSGAAPLAVLLVFLLLLTIGLAYEWFYGNLDWIRKGEKLIDSDEQD